MVGRVVTKDNNTWFVLVDVCKILGIKNSSCASSNLDDGEKDYAIINTASGLQETTIINEYGFLSLILRSRKPKVKQFKKWVTSKVLPSITQHSMTNN